MNDKVRKNIAIVGPAYPLRGGIANFNEAFAKALLKEEHLVKLYSFYYQYPNILFPGKSQYDNSESAPEGIRIYSTIGSIQPWSWKKTAKLILKQSPDVVFIRFWLPFMGPALGSIGKHLRKKGVKVIGITDNVIPHESRPGDAMLTKYFIKNCDGFITMSNSVLDDISKFTDNPKKIMLPHPVYDTFGEKGDYKNAIGKLKLNPKYNYVLFFGLIREYKGLDIAIDALSKVENKDIHLIIAGEFYDKKEKYTTQISQLKLEERIHLFDHYIPTEEVKDFFAVADAVVQPYKSATQSGITQVAYHFETPMIVSDVGGLPEIVPNDKAGYVVAPNANAFSKAISDFYELDKKNHFIEGVKTEKAKYEWNYFVNEALEFAS